MQAALRMLRERSTLEALGFQLSDHRFDVVEAAYFLRHVDRGSRGVHTRPASVRPAIDDRSADLDLITPLTDNDFRSPRLSFGIGPTACEEGMETATEITLVAINIKQK